MKQMSLLPIDDRLNGLPVSPEVRARSIITLLWQRYDAAGTSMGRGYEAVLLETAIELLGSPNLDDMALAEQDSYTFVNDTRDYVSAARAKQYGLI